jgi:hypothetical protein
MGTMESFERNRRLIEDFTTRTLSSIPSEYGRLVYVSTLRDLPSGRYLHAGLSSKYPDGAVNEVLGASHEELFARILEMPLETQLTDLQICLTGLGGDLGRQAARWRELQFYRALIPTGVSAELRELFCANLEALLDVVENESATVHAFA